MVLSKKFFTRDRVFEPGPFGYHGVVGNYRKGTQMLTMALVTMATLVMVTGGIGAVHLLVDAGVDHKIIGTLLVLAAIIGAVAVVLVAS